MMTVSPWAALLSGEPIRLEPRGEAVEPPARCGTKLAGLLALLAERDSATTHTLSVCADLTSRQVWGLLKAPRDFGQVQFDAGRWSLVREFAGRDVERAAALLRDLGWRVVPPTWSEAADPVPRGCQLARRVSRHPTNAGKTTTKERSGNHRGSR